jgi:hypothetical protein
MKCDPEVPQKTAANGIAAFTGLKQSAGAGPLHATNY